MGTHVPAEAENVKLDTAPGFNMKKKLSSLWDDTCEPSGPKEWTVNRTFSVPTVKTVRTVLKVGDTIRRGTPLHYTHVSSANGQLTEKTIDFYPGMMLNRNILHMEVNLEECCEKQ